MKILYFTDLHLNDQSITTRIDDSSQAGIDKLKRLVNLSLSEKVDIVISGGDEFHRRIENKFFLNQVVSLFAKFQAPVFTVMSNHVVRFNDFEDYKQRDIGVLLESGLLKFLTYLDYGSGIILGHHAYKSDPFMFSGDIQKVKFIIAHAYLEEDYPFSDRPGELIVSVHEFKKKFPNLQYLFLGHDHREYEVKDIDGVKVVRIGGALRVSSAKENLDRMPQCMIVDFDNLGETKFFPLSEKKGEEVFNLKIKDLKKEIKDFDIESFLQSVNNKSDNILAYFSEKYNSITDPELKDYIGKHYLSGIVEGV
jgi:DNA repair exonuclease SbcCD nuclease subunit